jgi:hypothetical protein
MQRRYDQQLGCNLLRVWLSQTKSLITSHPYVPSTSVITLHDINNQTFVMLVLHLEILEDSLYWGARFSLVIPR